MCSNKGGGGEFRDRLKKNSRYVVNYVNERCRRLAGSNGDIKIKAGALSGRQSPRMRQRDVESATPTGISRPLGYGFALTASFAVSHRWKWNEANDLRVGKGNL